MSVIINVRTLFVIFNLIFVKFTNYILFVAILGNDVSNGTATVRNVFRSIKYSFNSLTYLCRKSNYTHTPTKDDIVKSKYVYLDLLSTRHYEHITVTKMPDDPDNHRSNILVYEMSADAFVQKGASMIDDLNQNRKYNPLTDSLLTIGTVYFYTQKLHGKLKYHTRKVMTYNDEFGRFCVCIESYGNNNSLQMRRVYRERRFCWWLKLLSDEEVNITTRILSNSIIPAIKAVVSEVIPKHEDLNITTDSLPKYMTKIDINNGVLYCNARHNYGLITPNEVSFSNETVSIDHSVDVTDMFIYNLIEEGKTTHIVIAYIKNGIVVKYTIYKCLSLENNQYKPVDSLVDSSLLFTTIVTKAPDEILASNVMDVCFMAKQRNNLDEIHSFLTLYYPDSDHYIVRPLNLKNPTLFSTLNVHEPNEIYKYTINNTSGTFISMKQVTSSHKIVSISSSNNEFNVFKTFDVYHRDVKNHNSYPFEINSFNFIFNTYSPNYLSTSIFSKPISPPFVMEFDGNENLTFQFNDKCTFFTHDFPRFGHKYLEAVKLDQLKLDVLPNINSQVLYCQLDDVSFVTLLQARVQPAIYKQTDDEFVKVNDDEYKKLATEAGLDTLLAKYGFEEEVAIETVLDFNKSTLSEHINVVIITNDVVLYTTSYGYMINKVVWGTSCITLEGWSQVVKITSSGKYLLIDLVVDEDKSIVRQLYEFIGGNNGTLLLRSKVELGSLLKTSIENIKHKLRSTYYDLIPTSLDVFTDFDDPRLNLDRFNSDRFCVLYNNLNNLITLGDYTIHRKKYTTVLGHKWRQIIRTSINRELKYSIFTLMKDGINIISVAGLDSSTEETLPYDDLNVTITKPSIPLIVDSISFYNIDVTKSKLGDTELYLFKSPNNKSLNPIIFGIHEVKIMLDDGKISVTKAVCNNIVYITIEDVHDKFKPLLFKQTSNRSNIYEFMDATNESSSNTEYLPFIDVKCNIRYGANLFESIDYYKCNILNSGMFYL